MLIQPFVCSIKNLLIFLKPDKPPTSVMASNSCTAGTGAVVQNQISNICIGLYEILAQGNWFLRAVDR